MSAQPTRGQFGVHAHRGSRFIADRLPDPGQFYREVLGTLRGRGVWRMARCCFHDDREPSLSVNMECGAFKCHACGAKGGDVIDFYRKLHGCSFKDAARALGTWSDS